MARLSIGLPVYNGERFLTDAIASLLAQTFTDFELIISDNASVDATPRICADFAARDPRIRYVRNSRNLGAAPNYNRVFALSSGEYFKWASHDDVCAPTYLARCVEVLDRDPAVVLCYPRASIIDESGRVLRDYDVDLHLPWTRPSQRLHGYFLAHGEFHPIFGVLRRQALADTPLIADYVGSDLVLMARLALRGQFYEVPDRLFLRREHAGRSGHLPIHKFSRWWNTDKRGRLYFPRWRWLAAYAAAIAGANIPLNEKCRCSLELLRWTYWTGPRLVRELLLRA